MSFVGHDLRHAVRSLWSSRATTSLAILCLSLGIGVNTLVFSLVNALLLRPLPFVDPERLVVLNEVRQEDRLESGTRSAVAVVTGRWRIGSGRARIPSANGFVFGTTTTTHGAA
jgi:hypothetical protein